MAASGYHVDLGRRVAQTMSICADLETDYVKDLCSHSRHIKKS